MKTLSSLMILAALVVSLPTQAQRPVRQRSLTQYQSWQILKIRDKERALVYEVFFEPGVVQYQENSVGTSERWDYSTNNPSILDPPLLGYWNTPERRADRVFGAHSEGSGFAHADVATSGDAALWVFRSAEASRPAAFVVGLRAARTPAGASGTIEPSMVTVTLPPRSIARAAVVFRRSVNTMRVDFGQQYVEGDDERGGFLTVARNETNAAITINVTGRMDVNTPAGPTSRRMSLKSMAAGNDVTLITGRFLIEPACFAAAVITIPMP